MITLFFCSFIASLVSVWSLRKLAIKNSWLAQPREDRWHTKPIALHGGVAFCPVFFIGFSIIFSEAILSTDGSLTGLWSEQVWVKQSVALLLGSLMMFILGWLDDLYCFKPVTKLLVQLLAASLYINAGGVITLTGFELLDIGITYFWFIGITNAVNMLDNMDGLSSGVVIISTLFLVLLMNSQGGSTALAMSAAILLIGVLSGFLMFNYPPARIFMGDSGSLVIGFMLAALAVPGEYNGLLVLAENEAVFGPVLAILIPSTVLAVPILDTTLVTLTRKWRAQKASQGGQDHASHRLVMLGFSQRKALWILYVLAMLGGLVALGMLHFPNLSLVLFGGFMIVLILFGAYLGHVKVRGVDENKPRPGWTPLVTALLYKRRAAEILLDLMLILGAYYIAYLLRFDGKLTSQQLMLITDSAPVVVSATLIAFLAAGVYKGQWKMVSVHDLLRFFIGIIGGTVLSLAAVVMLNRFEAGQSRSAFIIYAVLLFLAMAATRTSFRLFDQVAQQHRNKRGETAVLIYGAGHAGKLLAQELSHRPEYEGFYLAGFIDDDAHKAGKEMAGQRIARLSAWYTLIAERKVEIWVSTRLLSDTVLAERLKDIGFDITMRRMSLEITRIT